MNLHEAKNELLNILDDALHKGHSESSLFFKNILKQLQELREYVYKELGEETVQGTNKNSAAETPDFAKMAGYTRVYISVYQAQGLVLERWVGVIKSLHECYASRAIYRNEIDAQEMLRAKRSESDGYVVAWVKESDIMEPAKGIVLHDRFGHELVSLKGGLALPATNIVEFVHINRRYSFKGEELILIS